MKIKENKMVSQGPFMYDVIMARKAENEGLARRINPEGPFMYDSIQTKTSPRRGLSYEEHMANKRAKLEYKKEKSKMNRETAQFMIRSLGDSIKVGASGTWTVLTGGWDRGEKAYQKNRDYHSTMNAYGISPGELNAILDKIPKESRVAYLHDRQQFTHPTRNATSTSTSTAQTNPNADAYDNLAGIVRNATPASVSNTTINEDAYDNLARVIATSPARRRRARIKTPISTAQTNPNADAYDNLAGIVRNATPASVSTSYRQQIIPGFPTNYTQIPETLAAEKIRAKPKGQRKIDFENRYTMTPETPAVRRKIIFPVYYQGKRFNIVSPEFPRYARHEIVKQAEIPRLTKEERKNEFLNYVAEKFVQETGSNQLNSGDYNLYASLD